ncbi:hypothetical protein PGB90_000351 [Kerria lacca]
MCLAIGIDIKNYIPDYIWNNIDRQILTYKCRYLEKYNSFPINITPYLSDLSYQYTSYDYILLGSTPSNLYLASQLISSGSSAIIIDNGSIPPMESLSSYYMYSLMESQYMKPCRGGYSGKDIFKNYYIPKIFGSYSSCQPSYLDYGMSSTYEMLSMYNQQFSWESCQSRYENLFTNGYGSYSSFQQSLLEQTILSGIGEMGYKNEILPYDVSCQPGMHILPVCGQNEYYDLFIFQIFSQMGSCDNLKLMLEIEFEKLIIQNGRACGIQIMTPYGSRQITANTELIMGLDTIATHQLLLASGIGSSSLLNQFNIPMQYELPSCFGNNINIRPIYTGKYLQIPRNSLYTNSYSDMEAFSYIFGNNRICESEQSLFYSLYFSVGGSSFSNCHIKYYPFNYYQIKKLEMFLRLYCQYDIKVIEYFLKIIYEFDIIFFTIEILNVSGGSSIIFNSITDYQLNYGFYDTEIDRKNMLEGISILEQLTTTGAFSSFGGQLNTVSLGGSFSSLSMEESLYYHTIPSYFNSYGGFPYTPDTSSSFINDQFYLQGLNNLRMCGPGIYPGSPYVTNNFALDLMFSSFMSDLILNRNNCQGGIINYSDSGSFISGSSCGGYSSSSSSSGYSSGGYSSGGCGCGGYEINGYQYESESTTITSNNCGGVCITQEETSQTIVC